MSKCSAEPIRRVIYKELSTLGGASPSRPLPPAVITGVLGCLDPDWPADGRISFLRELPEPAQVQVWQNSFQNGLAPGFLAGKGSIERVAFFLATFRPDIFPDYPFREEFFRHAVEVMSQNGKTLVPGRSHPGLDRMRTALATLTRAEHCDARLRKELAERLADEFTKVYPTSPSLRAIYGNLDRTSEFRDAIRDPLYKSASYGPHTLAEFCYRISHVDIQTVLLLLFDLDLAEPASPLFLKHLQFLSDQKFRSPNDHGAAVFAITLRMVLELVELIGKPTLLSGSVFDRDRVNYCKLWLEQLRKHEIPPELYRKFILRLSDSLTDLNGVHHLAVASLYLASGIDEEVGIFERALSQMDRSPASMVRSLKSGSSRVAKSGPVHFLARLLMAAESRGSGELERSAHTVYTLTLALSGGEREEWCRLIEKALRDEEAGGSVWRRVEKAMLKASKTGGWYER